MSPGDGLSAEMRRLLKGFRDDPLVLDDDSADRLLAGRMDPADAPPGFAEAATVMAAATAPARPDELNGVESAMDVYRAALVELPSPPRRPFMLVKLLTVKAAVAVFSGALLVGGVAAAATGSLPDAAQRVVDRVVDGQASSAQGQGVGNAANSTEATSHGKGQAAGATQGQAGSHSTGPDLSKIDRKGLCTAYMAGKGAENGGKYDAAAFEALEKAAGGADKVADYCKDVTATDSAGQSGQAGTGAADEHAQQGQEQGQGQPPAGAGSAGGAGGAGDAGQGQGGGGQR
jgi:hypothetical protein